MFLKGKDSQHCTSVEAVTLNPNNDSFEFIVSSSNNASKQLHAVLTYLQVNGRCCIVPTVAFSFSFFLHLFFF